MHIVYVANVRMPTEKAHGAQIAKTCEALQRRGVEVELIVPTRRNAIQEDVPTYYALAEKFPVRVVFAPDTLWLGRIGFFIESLWFALSAIRHVPKDALVYGRDEIVLFVLTLLGKRVVWESHTGAWNVFARHVIRRAKRLIVISKGLRDFYISHKVPETKIVVAADAIDIELFSTAESKEKARTRLGLGEEQIALYVGRLGSWKGVDTLLEASKFLEDIRVVIIGGTTSEIESLRPKYPRVTFLGEKPYRELHHNLAAADVLVLPNTAKDRRAYLFTSPLKLFAYMAAKKPIVASDIPSTREVLHGDAAFWFTADDPSELARAIREACSAPDAPQKAALAHKAVGAYTWEKRGEIILSSLQ